MEGKINHFGIGEKLETRKVDKKLLILFSIVPIFSIFKLDNLTYSPDLIRLFILSIFTIFSVFIFRDSLKIRSKFHLVPIFLILIYLINQLFVKNDLSSFFLGKYNRFGGFITLTCLTLYFIIVSNLEKNSINIFCNLIYVTYILMLLNGLLTLADILPNDNYFDANEKVAKISTDLSLTFGNSNIASAFLGISLSFHIFMIVSKKFRNIFLQGIIFALGLFILLKTNSIQGWFILFICLALIVLHFIRKGSLHLNLKFSSALFMLLIIVSYFKNLKSFWDKFIINATVEARINYWGATIKIWSDQKFTGVGLDNLGEVATYYRDFELAKQEGLWTIPDRSHNVVLDHLVNGGILAFAIWLIFIFYVSILAMRRIVSRDLNEFTNSNVVVALIWFGYLFQSFISVDHVFLTMIGYFAAGLVYADHLRQYNIEKFSINLNFLAILFIVIILNIFLIYQLFFGYQVNQFLNKGNTRVLDKIYNARFIEQQSYLDIVVKLSSDKQFQLASLFATRLLEENSYASQAYYARSVYFESIKDLSSAKTEMEKAHKFDKFNSVYTLSLGIYEFNLKNFTKSKYWLEETIKLNDSQQGIEILINSLKQVGISL